MIKNTKGQEGQSANPDAKHYLHKDIFSYVTYAEVMNTEEDTAQFRKHIMKVGDTAYYSSGIMILEKIREIQRPTSIISPTGYGYNGRTEGRQLKRRKI